ASHEYRTIVILTAHRAAGHAAQHGNLPGMGKSVGNRALKELLRSGGERRAGSKVIVESLKRTKKPHYFLRPGERNGILPGLLALGDGEGPVKEIAHVGQNVGGHPPFFAGAERGKAGGRIAQRFSRAVG